MSEFPDFDALPEIGLRADHSTLVAEASGLDCTRYRVELTQSVDGRWVGAYEAVQGDSKSFRRFRLEAGNRAISFTSRTVDGPALVMDALQRLDVLVELVNRNCARRAGPAT